MYEAIVGLIALMLIVYLFIMVFRPERVFDRLIQKDSSAPGDSHVRFKTSTGSNEHPEFSASNGNCGTIQSGTNHRKLEEED